MEKKYPKSALTLFLSQIHFLQCQDFQIKYYETLQVKRLPNVKDGGVKNFCCFARSAPLERGPGSSHEFLIRICNFDPR